MLFIVALILAAGFIKYADTPFAQTARSKAAEVLAGAPSFDKILSVIGGAPVSDGASEVFGAQSGNSGDKSGKTSQDGAVSQTNESNQSGASYAASSGGADDILGREKTLFPDTVDETVYPMKFDHIMPIEGEQTSSFGSRLSPITGQPGFHYGLDIAAEEGVPIGAFAAGTVREVGESSYGKYLILDHNDGFATLYAHCSAISAKVGDTVACGDEIALVGQTGNATGPHLHLEIWKDGAALDPADYLADA